MCGDCGALNAVVAHEHVVGIKLLGDLIERGARRPGAGRNSEPVKCAEPVFTAHDEETSGAEPRREDLRKRLTDPVKPRRGGSIFKGYDQQQTAHADKAGLLLGRRGWS